MVLFTLIHTIIQTLQRRFKLSFTPYRAGVHSKQSYSLVYLFGALFSSKKEKQKCWDFAYTFTHVISQRKTLVVCVNSGTGDTGTSRLFRKSNKYA